LTVFGLILVTFLLGPAPCQALGGEDPQQSTQQERFAALKSQGVAASLTIAPVVLAGRPMGKVGEVVGIMLEQSGMTNLEVSTAAYTPPSGADLAGVAQGFGQFIGQNPVETDYVLWGEYLGSPQSGVSEIRGVVVDREGNLVWSHSETPEGELFKEHQPADPMGCSVVLAQLVGRALNLPEPQEDAIEGKLAKRFREQAGLPEDKVYQEMESRQQAVKKAGSDVTMAVYPVRLGDKVDQSSAELLAKLINEAGLCRASVASEQPWFEIKRDSNQQKLLWSLARQFRDHLSAQPKPTADYVLYADYYIGENAAHAVHFVVCDSDNNWVVVDFANSHHEDFQKLAPKTWQDCSQHVVQRLEGYLK
jgi:hypothetical protein